MYVCIPNLSFFGFPFACGILVTVVCDATFFVVVIFLRMYNVVLVTLSYFSTQGVRIV